MQKRRRIEHENNTEYTHAQMCLHVFVRVCASFHFNYHIFFCLFLPNNWIPFIILSIHAIKKNTSKKNYYQSSLNELNIYNRWKQSKSNEIVVVDIRHIAASFFLYIRLALCPYSFLVDIRNISWCQFRILFFQLTLIVAVDLCI